MKKFIRDGHVAVLYSPGFGAGWFTWNTQFPECIFDVEIVEMIQNHVSWQEIADFAEKKYGEEFCSRGAKDLRIMWLKEGTEFIIDEYDGSESIRTKEIMDWIQA